MSAVHLLVFFAGRSSRLPARGRGARQVGQYFRPAIGIPHGADRMRAGQPPRFDVFPSARVFSLERHQGDHLRVVPPQSRRRRVRHEAACLFSEGMFRPSHLGWQSICGRCVSSKPEGGGRGQAEVLEAPPLERFNGAASAWLQQTLGRQIWPAAWTCSSFERGTPLEVFAPR